MAVAEDTETASVIVRRLNEAPKLLDKPDELSAEGLEELRERFREYLNPKPVVVQVTVTPIKPGGDFDYPHTFVIELGGEQCMLSTHGVVIDVRRAS
jgi:hypothetical protein